MSDFLLEETVHFLFTTRAFATGIPTVLAGTPVLSVYEDASATQITAGVSVGADHDSVVGLNLATIVATAANGYETGKSYAVVITTGTVGGVSVVGEVVAEFSIQRSPAFARLGAPAGASVSADIAIIDTVVDAIPTTAMRGTDNVVLAGPTKAEMDTAHGLLATEAKQDIIDTNVDQIETAVITNAAGTDIAADIIAVKAETASIQAETTPILVDTADMQPKLGAPAGADMSADIAAIEAQTDDIGVAGAGLTDLGGMSTAMKAEVNAEADTAISDAALATAANLATVDTVVDAIKVVTDALGATAAANLALAAGVMVPATVDTATNSHTPTTTEFQADDVTEATADHFNGRVIIFTSGTVKDQATSISDYVAVGGIGQFTVVALTEAPLNNDTFIIL